MLVFAPPEKCWNLWKAFAIMGKFPNSYAGVSLTPIDLSDFVKFTPISYQIDKETGWRIDVSDGISVHIQKFIKEVHTKMTKDIQHGLRIY